MVVLKPCDWIEHDVNWKYCIDAFGRTESGDIAKVRITTFKPYFYLRRENETKYEILSALETKTGRKNFSQFEAEMKLDAMKGFNNFKEEKVWKIVCSSLVGFKCMIRDLKDLKVKSRIIQATDIYEGNLPPLICFFHEMNLAPTSPFEFEEESSDPEDNENVDVCYSVEYTDIKQKTSPIPLYACAYDLEVYSSIKGKFPVHENVGDEIMQIGMSFRWTDSMLEADERIVLVSGKCAPSTDPSVTFVSCKNEKDLLLKFQEYVAQYNPDIMSGYHTFGFDDAYIAERAKLHKLELQFGRVPSKQWKNPEFVKTERKAFELATGTFAVRYLDMPGRWNIDLYLIMRREQILDSYKLDAIASAFLRDKVVNVEGNRFYTKSTRGLFVGNLVRLDIVTNTLNPYQNGKKFEVTEVTSKYFEIRETLKFTPFELEKLEWCFSKDDITPEEMFASHFGTSEQKAEVAKYCIQDCDLVLTLMTKLDIIVNACGMADVCRVPVQYIFLRGEGIKIYSVVRYSASKRNQIIVTQERIEDSDDSYEGAIVLPPKIGMYLDQPIPVLDFNSLYPSNMIAYNLSPDTLVYVKTYDVHGKLISNIGSETTYKVDNVSYDLKNEDGEVTGRVVCGFVQPTDNHLTVGLIPLALDIMLKKRKEVRKMIETTDDPAQKAVLNGLQLAYKKVANSMYGQTGSRTSPISKFEIAACTTAVGRNKIIDAKGVVEGEFHAEVIYGDSVAFDTEIEVRIGNGDKKVLEISELGNDWKSCTDSDKEYCELENIYSPTEEGWTKIHRIIRHKLDSHKKMIRVWIQKIETCNNKIYDTKYIDVTDDHSLIDANNNIIKPSQDIIGKELLQQKNSEFVLKVLSIEEILYNNFVYDLTTDNHHFQAGPFGLVVHNTDSIFIKFPTKDLQESMDLARKAAEAINSRCRKAHKIEYEKTLFPFIIFSPKRYVGMMYTDDVTKCKPKSMGVATKRRDNAPIVKDIFGGAIDILLEEKDISKAQKFVQDMLVEVITDKIPLDKYIITKQLRDDYKNPDQIAHAVLAKRMKVRDAGSAPQVGDRIPYIFVNERKSHSKQGDKIEHVNYVKEKGLNPDTEFYITNQIQNPVAQLFALDIEHVKGFVPRTNYKKMFDEYIEDGKSELEATIKVQDYKAKELNNVMFLGASYLKKFKRGPMDMYFQRK